MRDRHAHHVAMHGAEQEEERRHHTSNLQAQGEAAKTRIANAGLPWEAHWGPREGIASFYGTSRHGDHSGDGFIGQKMANGEPMDPRALSCAHWTIPLGALVRVTYQGKSVDVHVEDRGPNPRLHRVIDLTPAAARAIGITGTGHVHLDVLSK